MGWGTVESRRWTARKWAVLRGITWLAVVLGGVWAFLCSMSLYNRFYILYYVESYSAGEFVVSGSHYSTEGEHGPSYWLVGTISGGRTGSGLGGRDGLDQLVGAGKERFAPPPRTPANRSDLERIAPPGTVLPVWYNPDATISQVQGETLRVLPRTGPDLRAEQTSLAWELGLAALGPLCVALVARVAVWIAWWRAALRPAPLATEADTKTT